jgi:glycosyltransferase 2 family protein
VRLTNKQIAFFALKIAVSGTLLAFIFKKTGLEQVLNHFQSMNLWLFGLSSLLYVLLVLVSAHRWALLLEEQYPLKRIFSLYMIGCFFNNLLPGAIGGDAVKAYYLYKDTRKGGSSIGSVFMDRYIGLCALLFLGFISSIAAFNELKSIGMHLVIPALFFLFIGGSLLFFWLRIGRRFSTISDFYDYFHRSVRNKTMLLKAFGLSLVVQALSLLMIYLIARGIDQDLTFTALFVFVPIIHVITMLPISISGLGIRESAFVLLFGLTGVPSEASMSISFLWFLSIVTASLIGLVEYLRMQRH